MAVGWRFIPSKASIFFPSASLFVLFLQLFLLLNLFLISVFPFFPLILYFFPSFLLFCHSAFYGVFSLLHLAPLKVFADAAAWQLWEEGRQCPQQDCRTMESEASNKGIGSNSLLWGYSNRTVELPAWKNPSILNAPFLALETFAAPPVNFLGWSLLPFSQNFMEISVFFDCHTALQNPQITSKTLTKDCELLFYRLKYYLPQLLSCTHFGTFKQKCTKMCKFTFQNQKCACCNKVLSQLLITSLSSPHFIKLFCVMIFFLFF